MLDALATGYYDRETLAYTIKTLIQRLDEREPWRKDALCREHPEIDFFPARGESTEPARAICGRCLVQRECRAYSETLSSNECRVGVWAATSARERRGKRPAQRRPKASSCTDCHGVLPRGRVGRCCACEERETAPGRKPGTVAA